MYGRTYRRPNWKRAGITLMELVVVTGIISIILTTVISIIFTVQSTYFRSAMRLDNIIEKSLGERTVWLNLLNAGPSFNNINQPDDNGREFFDYFPDFPAKLIAPAAAQTRIMVLDAADETIRFLLFNRHAIPPVYYDTARAYNVALGADVSLAGTTSFVSVNQGGYLDSLNPNIFLPDKLVLLYSPVYVRPIGAAMNVAPRFTIYTGAVSGAALAADTAGGIIRNTHPISGAVIANEDEFFRQIPATGGGSQLTFVAGVELVEYRVVNTPVGLSLRRRTWHPPSAAFENDVPVAMNIQRVIFTRPSVTVPVVGVDVQFNF